DDHLVRAYHRFDMRRIARRTIESGDRDRALRLVCAEQFDVRVERCERNGHVRWMRRDTRLAGAEDGEVAIESADRRASGTRRAFVATRGTVIVEVRTARTLQQIPADGRLVAKLTRRTRDECFGQHGIALAHERMRRNLRVRRLRADAQSALRQLRDSLKWQ